MQGTNPKRKSAWLKPDEFKKVKKMVDDTNVSEVADNLRVPRWVLDNVIKTKGRSSPESINTIRQNLAA